MDDEEGKVVDIIIDTLAFPRGGGAVTGEVRFTLGPRIAERDGAEIAVLTGVNWEREGDITEAVRLRLARSAHRLLKAAADLSDDELLRLLESSLFEDDLPDLHKGRHRH